MTHGHQDSIAAAQRKSDLRRVDRGYLGALCMNVSGIDPAPRKGLSVFDGADHEVKIEDAVATLADLAVDDCRLVCWDAPLTGPPSSVVGGAAAAGPAFSQRPIESFFSRKCTGFRTPKGIAVLPFSGCSHWALTRCLLGLPRVGRFDMPVESLPFQLATCDDERPVCGRHVVEVHPAVALWLWCREGRSATASCHYKNKKDRAVLLELWERLLEVPAVAAVLFEVRDIAPKSDDQLDARVAYALGRLWLDDQHSVVLLGNADTGAFLVPAVPGIEDAFCSFIARLPDASTRADRVTG